MRPVSSGSQASYQRWMSRPGTSARMAATHERTRGRSGATRMSRGISHAGGAGRSLPPSGTSRRYSQPPMSPNSMPSSRKPSSAHMYRSEALRTLITPRVNGVHGWGECVASRVQ